MISNLINNIITGLFKTDESEEEESIHIPPLISEGELTKDGLKVIAEYYNQKYPERGEIIPVFVDFSAMLDSTLSDKPDNTLIKIAQNTANHLNELRQENDEPLKIILTAHHQGALSHSNPYIITPEKLIALRDESSNGWFSNVIAPLLGLTKINARTVEINDKVYSSQKDFKSCHFISLGILKDITKEDIKKISAFQDQYTPLPKMLKYCQSAEYAESMLLEEYENAAIKNDNTTLPKYYEKHNDFNRYYNQETTRINNKAKEFMIDLKFAEMDLKEQQLCKDTPPTTIAASKILEDRRKNKAVKLSQNNEPSCIIS